MVLTAGIKPDESLSKIFDQSNSITNKIRFICLKIKPDGSATTLYKSCNSSGKPDNEEFDFNLVNVFDPNDSQVIFYELDDKSWLQILYLPDSAKVKDKMLYASTLGSLKESFGVTRVSDSFTVSSTHEMRWFKIQKDHLDKGDKNDLLSEKEKAIINCQRQEETARAYLVKNQPAGIQSGALDFRLSPEAEQAIGSDFVNGFKNFVVLKLDVQNEIINLVQSYNFSESDLAAGKLSQAIITDSASYNLLKFGHAGTDYNIFFMCMPSNAGLKIKEKMLNASCKNAMTGRINNYGIRLDHNLEIDDGSEVANAELIKGWGCGRFSRILFGDWV